MAETLVNAVPLPHLDLEKIIDQICGCDADKMQIVSMHHKITQIYSIQT